MKKRLKVTITTIRRQTIVVCRQEPDGGGFTQRREGERPDTDLGVPEASLRLRVKPDPAPRTKPEET